MLITRGSLLLVIVLSCTLGGCGGAQSRYASHMKRGQAYFDQGDFNKANVEFRNALQIEPKDAAARLADGRALVRLERPREAWGAFQAVVDSDANNVEARTELARLFIMQGSLDQGMKALEPGLKSHPDDVALLSLRATARARLQDHAGAIADAEHALRIAPNNEEAIQVRAGLFKQAGDLASAKALIDGAVSRDPKSTLLREMLVDLALAANDSAQAEQQLSEIIKLAPQEPEYRFRLAMLYSRTKQLDEAQRILEQAVKDFPKSDAPKLALVDFESHQRTAAEGQKRLKDFIARAPDDYVLRFALAAMLQRADATKEAIAVYDEVIRRDDTGPSGLIARDRLAQIAATQGREAEARKLLAEVLLKNPHDGDALALRASMEMAHTEPAAAIVDLRALLREHPQASGVQRLLGRAYLANGQPALAQQAFEAAVDLAPADTALRLELGQVLMQIQKPDQAIAVLQEAIKRAPTDNAARTELVRAYLDKKDFRAAHTAAADLTLMNPQSAAGFYLAAMADLGLNQIDEARKSLETALALQPKSIDVLSALARLDMAQGQAARAVTRVKSASDQDPSDAALLNLDRKSVV